MRSRETSLSAVNAVLEKVVDKPETPEAPKPVDPDACPKCGRVIKRGKYMHVKHCKGK